MSVAQVAAAHKWWMPSRLNKLRYRISRSAKIGLVHFPQPFVLWKVELRQLLHDDRRWHQLLQGI
jgi:hypothetical protein